MAMNELKNALLGVTQRAQAEDVAAEVEAIDAAPVAIETTLRDILYDICDQGVAEVDRITALLDAAVLLARRGKCSRDTPLQLLEEALDTRTVESCDRLFAWLEENRAGVTEKMGAGLTLLRLCNELLRRLSKGRDNIFCGRILVFLSQVFPLSERSAVNRSGEYNTEKSLDVEEDDGDEPMEDGDGDDSSVESIAARIYRPLWSLQKVFTFPPSLKEIDVRDRFKAALTATVDAFAAVQKLNGDAERRAAEQPQVQSYFTPRHLKARELLPLELADVSFRRHICVQALIILDFLSLHGSKARSLPAETSKSMQPTFKLRPEDETWLRRTEVHIQTLLLKSSPNGKRFLRTVRTALDEDRLWLLWKCRSCPSYERPPVSEEQLEQSRQTVAKMQRVKPAFPHAMGNATLTRIWKQGGGWSHEELQKPWSPPTLESYLEGMKRDDMDLEMATDPDEVEHLKAMRASKAWRAFRLCRQTDSSLFTAEVAGGNLEALLERRAQRDSVAEAGAVEGQAAAPAQSQTQAVGDPASTMTASPLKRPAEDDGPQSADKRQKRV